MRITNRYAFRYVKIEVIATSIRFGLQCVPSPNLERVQAHPLTLLARLAGSRT